MGSDIFEVLPDVLSIIVAVFFFNIKLWYQITCIKQKVPHKSEVHG